MNVFSRKSSALGFSMILRRRGHFHGYKGKIRVSWKNSNSGIMPTFCLISHLLQRRAHSNTPVFFKGSAIVNGPQSLAAESSVQTPPEKRVLKKKKNRLSLLSMKERAEHSQNLARPETREEFLSLDFVSRCAVAGLLLGRT